MRHAIRLFSLCTLVLLACCDPPPCDAGPLDAHVSDVTVLEMPDADAPDVNVADAENAPTCADSEHVSAVPVEIAGEYDVTFSSETCGERVAIMCVHPDGQATMRVVGHDETLDAHTWRMLNPNIFDFTVFETSDDAVRVCDMHLCPPQRDYLAGFAHVDEGGCASHVNVMAKKAALDCT